MPESLTALPAPDVDLAFAQKIRDDVLTDVAGVKVGTRFPLDGTDLPSGATGVLVVARTTPGGGDLGNGLYVANYTVDVWAGDRATAFAVSDRVRVWLVQRGGRRVDENGVMTVGRCTNRPARVDDPRAVSDRIVRYLATYELTLRAAAQS